MKKQRKLNCIDGHMKQTTLVAAGIRKGYEQHIFKAKASLINGSSRIIIHKGEVNMDTIENTQTENVEIQKCLANLKEKLCTLSVPPISENELSRIIGAVSKSLNSSGFIRLNSANINAITDGAKSICIATGFSDGDNKSEGAVRAALSDPQTNLALAKARGAIVLIDGAEDADLGEVEKAASLIRKVLQDRVNSVVLSGADDTLGSKMRVTLVIGHL